MEKRENTIKKKLEVYDRGQMYLMKLLDNYQDVPGTKKDLQLSPIWMFINLAMWQTGDCVPRSAGSETTLLISLFQKKCQHFASKPLLEY